LGRIGPKAEAAVGALREAAKDAGLREEADTALRRIVGDEAGAQVAASVSSAVTSGLRDQALAGLPIAGEGLQQAATGYAGNPPADWDVKTGRNTVWSVELGDETFGRPVVCGDVVYIGTDNARHMNPAFKDECGVLMALRATNGTFLWQDLAPRV